MGLTKRLARSIWIIGLSTLVACAREEPKELKEEAEYVTFKAPEVQYLSGKVMGENFQRNFADPHRYFFSLQTADSSMKLIVCAGDYNASQMDALVNKESNIKLRLESRANSPKPTDQEFYLCKENLVEIDGMKVDFSKPNRF
ncbi:MAG: hypothetical protein AABX26_01675 [Nanoarchaeota archaeon]